MVSNYINIHLWWRVVISVWVMHYLSNECFVILRGMRFAGRQRAGVGPVHVRGARQAPAFRARTARGQSSPRRPASLILSPDHELSLPGRNLRKMAADDRSRSEAAKQRRQDQLQRWLESETDRTGTELRDRPLTSGGRRARVCFAQGAVFMAACSAGDREEVSELLKQGADINHANVDGLTALHQVSAG